MYIISNLQIKNAPDTCPHGFKVSMSVLAGLKNSIIALLLMCFCCGIIALSAS